MLLFSFDYPPLDGGIARLCAQIGSGLQRRKAPIRVLTCAFQGAAGSDVPAVPEIRVSAQRLRREWEAWRQLRKLPDREAVLTGIWYPDGLVAALADVRPFVVLAHGLELLRTQSRWRRPIWHALRRWVLERADLVIANSDYTLDLVREVAPRAVAMALPLAVDERRFLPGDRDAARRRWNLGPDQRVLLTVSRLSRYKAHDVILQALAALPAEIRRRFVYLVAGQGAARAWFEAEARRLGVAELVRWLGYVPEQDLPDLYRAADLFALCTRESRAHAEVEGFGLVFLEAQACATPAVGTRCGGIPSAIEHGNGGWLIEPDDVMALTVLLQRLDADPQAFRQMGLAGRRRVESACTWDCYLNNFLAALQKHSITRD